MSRFNAILLVVLASLASPAFSADPPAGTTVDAPAAAPPAPTAAEFGPSPEELDSTSGLLRSTPVRPLRGVPPVQEPAAARPAPAAPTGPSRPHIALILPTASATLGPLSEALRAGFMAAVDAAGGDRIPVHLAAVENELAAIPEACRQARATGALVVVGGLTRDGAQAIAASDCARLPVLALNELRGEAPPTVYSVSLSLEQEARQVALMAVADGWRTAAVITGVSPLSRRVQEAFEREWTRAAGLVRRIPYTGVAEDAPALRERILSARVDMVFMALTAADAVVVRPYVSGMLPLYATSLSVNPRAEAIVNVDLQGVRYVEMPWFVQPDHPAVMAYAQPQGAMSTEQERLYAFGIDAYRLAMLLARKEPPTLDGVTGRITLEAGQVFVRHLAPAEVDGGRVIPLRAP